MKRLSVLIVFLLLCAALTGTARAETWSIQQLRSLGEPVWQETYQAYGREIRVDVMAEIPAADTLPVLEAIWMPPLDELTMTQLTKAFQGSGRTDRTTSFRSDSYSLVLEENLPVWDESKGQTPGKVGQKYRALFDYEMDGNYADGNDLTVREAIEIAAEKLKLAYPDMEMQLLDAALHGPLYEKSTGRQLWEKGAYGLQCAQMIRGIPVLTDASEFFLDIGRLPRGAYSQHNRGLIQCEIFDADSWSLVGNLLKETGVVRQDVSVVSFDTVKPQLESLIRQGKIRRIYHVGLGYALYMQDLNRAEPVYLVPAWVVWCDYFGSPREGDNINNVNGADIFRDSLGYHSLVFDAQTGSMIDLESTDYAQAVYR